MSEYGEHLGRGVTMVRLTHYTQSERDFQRQIVDLATICGWLVFHDTDSRKNVRGLPDLILCHPGDSLRPPRFLAWELKTRKRGTTPEQDMWLAALRAAGVEAAVLRPTDWEHIESVLRNTPL